MAITSVKIHPAIGIARVGNSPDDFFLGPEKPWERPDPPGGFKDAQCRVKRQGARFRIFAYHDDNSIQELTAAEASITWTVHVANKKAVSRNSESASDMTIDPGSRTLVGPNQREVFDNGEINFSGASPVTVPLGEIRTDNDGHLIVLGGFGKSESPTGAGLTSFLDNDDWYDDVADGPVTAAITVNGDNFTAEGAWVIVAPPKFAPQIDNVIALYDTLFDLFAQAGDLTPAATPSYTNHIYPILQRARDTKWVRNIGGSHTWPDPVTDVSTRSAIFSRLGVPGTSDDMPSLGDRPGTITTLTQTQYDWMELWKDGTYTNDWAGPPTPPANITPDGLDQAALENCVGAAFYPGIEAGGYPVNPPPITNPSNYSEPFRLDHSALGPGDITERMALPWQADFFACSTNWWPVPRPNDVIPQGATGYQSWSRDVGSYEEMANNWHLLGFVVKQGTSYVEVDRCAGTFITLVTPTLNFQDVPQGPMSMSRQLALPIAFEVKSTGAAVTLEIQTAPSHPRLNPYDNSITVGPTIGDAIETARIWIVYETGAVGEIITGEQTVVTNPDSGETWTIEITANTVGRKTAAAALVLDRSGSMSEDRGDGETKHKSLQEAATIFIDVMLEGDAAAVVRYNQDAQLLEGVTALAAADDIYDPGRTTIKNRISGSDLDPDGYTSIGDGIYEGRQALNAGGTGYDITAQLVLTDGKENRERWISDVATEISDTTYAIGLGTPENTSAPALQSIAGNHGGYLLITGEIAGDKRFILQKYFLQILAGISNAEIVTDPEGELSKGSVHRVPFELTEADSGVDVILLTPYPQYVDFQVQTPNGLMITPAYATADPGMRFVLSRGVSYYRITLPAELVAARPDHPGKWHAILRIGRPGGAGHHDIRYGHTTTRSYTTIDGNRRTLPYSVVVHSYSNLSFRTSMQQSGFEPGATVTLHATVTESGIPMAGNATVWAEVVHPDGIARRVDLKEHEEGQFTGSFETSMAGVYRCRIRASGRSRAGHPFQRERTVTAAVWLGGDQDAVPGRDRDVIGWIRERDRHLCELLKCLFGERVMTDEFAKRLREAGIDIHQLRRCLSTFCKSLPERANAENGPSRSDTRSSQLSDSLTLLRELGRRFNLD